MIDLLKTAPVQRIHTTSGNPPKSEFLALIKDLETQHGKQVKWSAKKLRNGQTQHFFYLVDYQNYYQRIEQVTQALSEHLSPAENRALQTLLTLALQGLHSNPIHRPTGRKIFEQLDRIRCELNPPVLGKRRKAQFVIDPRARTQQRTEEPTQELAEQITETQIP